MWRDGKGKKGEGWRQRAVEEDRVTLSLSLSLSLGTSLHVYYVRKVPGLATRDIVTPKWKPRHSPSKAPYLRVCGCVCVAVCVCVCERERKRESM